jgi:hypothetical protein
MYSLLLGFLAISSLFLWVPSAFAQADQISIKLQSASDAVSQAFNAVLDAENAGANVTNSLYQLNVAADLLAQAENAYRTSDNNTATANVGNVLLITQQVMTAAQNAKQEAAVSSQTAFWSAIAFTVIVAVVFIVVLYITWRWFKAYYSKNLVEGAPEVASQ